MVVAPSVPVWGLGEPRGAVDCVMSIEANSPRVYRVLHADRGSGPILLFLFFSWCEGLRGLAHNMLHATLRSYPHPHLEAH
jgi:hypothetical protein